jgi:hypothetical protein
VGCYTTGAGGRSGPAVDAAAVLALANCLPVGTGGAPEQVGDASPAQDATSVIDGSWYIDGGQCIVPLDALGCAPTLEHAGDSACAVCKGWARGCPVVVTCANNRLQYEESSPAGGRTCSYDATTHALIGGATNAFTNGFCEGLTGYAGEQGCDYAYDATSYPSPYCP